MKRDTCRTLSLVGMPDSARKLESAPPPRGVLFASAVDPADGCIHGRRVLPAPELADFVHHYWSVRWELRAPFFADTLPHPAGRIELEEHDGAWRAQVVGVRTGRFAKRHTGVGQVFGVQFRPAALQPLLRAREPMAAITDRAVPVAHVLGESADAWARAVRVASTIEAQVALTEAFLLTRLPSIPPEVARMRDLMEMIAADRSLRCVEQVAALVGVDHRSLQRRFRRFVGVHPKWVIQRYRLLEAVAQLGAANRPSLAALATSLGYADQAHFQREFRVVTGRTPGSFTRPAPVVEP
ncbi:MAG TPA: AraC family transcriptional regulator [Polyangiales bacterium]|nr:AraC family transcriptional regulator [Polyangiales bacterium]